MQYEAISPEAWRELAVRDAEHQLGLPSSTPAEGPISCPKCGSSRIFFPNDELPPPHYTILNPDRSYPVVSDEGRDDPEETERLVAIAEQQDRDREERRLQSLENTRRSAAARFGST